MSIREEVKIELYEALDGIRTLDDADRLIQACPRLDNMLNSMGLLEVKRKFNETEIRRRGTCITVDSNKDT